MIKTLALFFALALGQTGLQAADAPAALSQTPAVAPAAPSAPLAPLISAPAISATAALEGPDAPAAPAGSSSTAVPAGDEITVPEEVLDPLAMASEAPITDLKPVSSTVLAKMAKDLDKDQNELFFDAEHSEMLKDSAPGAWRVDVTALYAELAHRLAYHEDKDARQALNLADLRRDERAKEARELAFADKLADAVIAQLEAGKPKAQAELEALAGKGNRRARQYLGLDKLPEAPAAAPLSPTAAPLTAALSPTASALSPSAAVVSPTAAPVAPVFEAKPTPATVVRP